MRVLLDTSVLVAAAVVGHAHERRALVWLTAARAGGIQAAVTAHGCAEAWATLTALPVSPRIDATLAERVVFGLAAALEVVDLTWADYRAAMARCGDRGLKSGALYDALHLVGAERWGADALITFNARDFERLAISTSPRVVVPPDPPEVRL